MISSILQGRQPRYLPLWLDFRYVVEFRIVFRYPEVTFSFHLRMYDDARFQYS